MDYADIFNRFILVTAITSGASVAGVGLLAFAPKTWVGRTILAAAAVLVAVGLSAVCAPQYAGWLAGGGSLVAAGGVLASTAAVRRAVARCAAPLCRPRVAGLAALAAAAGLWGFESLGYDSRNEQMMNSALTGADSTPPTAAPVATARTDRGTAIDLFAAANPLDTAAMSEMEAQSPTLNNLSGRYLRRKPGGDESNCHGWVFTGGRYLLLGHFIDVILSDNGYATVTDPAAGDVCVYRDPLGQVTHTGLVRAVLDDGTVLVESKWGRLGVFLHGVGESCYGTRFTYHRTARGGHQLGGLTQAEMAAAEQP